jgi:hypothetical protein
VTASALASSGRGYRHMGAVLCDAGLQAAVNYRTVVAPRIDRLLQHWPCAHTTAAFERKALRYGLTDVLRWHDQEKLDRIHSMTALLSRHGVDTPQDAQQWLSTATAETRLLDIHGVGAKTVDYLRILVGVPGLAVDRHIRAFAASAGARGTDRSIKRQLARAAFTCGLPLDHVDQLVWRSATGTVGKTDTFNLRELYQALARGAAEARSPDCEAETILRA